MSGAERDAGGPTVEFGDSALNTDRELWRGTDPAGDYYADSVFVTDWGGIGIQTGGFNVVKTPREWVDLAWPPCVECGGRVGHIHWCSAGRPPVNRRARIRAFFARFADWAAAGRGHNDEGGNDAAA